MTLERRTELKRGAGPKRSTIRYIKPGEPDPPGEPRRYESKANGYVRLRWKVGKGQYAERWEREPDGRPVRTRPLMARRRIDRNEVRRLYVEEGKSTPEIARATGFNSAAIWRVLEDQGVVLGRSSGFYAKPVDLESLLRRYDDGESYKRIGLELGVSVQRVRRLLIENGRTVPRSRTKTTRSYEHEFNRMRPAIRARSGGRCEARFDEGCLGVGTHIHHRKLRSQGGPNTMANLLDTCIHCHARIHGNPKVSYARGLLIRASGDPSITSVDGIAPDAAAPAARLHRHIRGVQRSDQSAKNPWRAQIMVRQKTIHLGLFPTVEAAIEARQAAEVEHFGELCS